MNDLTSDRRTVLQAFSRALDGEAHVLTQHPDLLWQQLYNRLQWADEPVTHFSAPPQVLLKLNLFEIDCSKRNHA